MSDIKMTEVERIKKSIESAVTVFVGQDENEQGIILSKLSLFYLITTIESQKEEIESLKRDKVSRETLLDCLKKELELCAKEKFNEKKTRFYLGRETALTDIIGHIESGRFNIPSTEAEAQIESLKAITELAVKGLERMLKITSDGSEPDKWNGSTGGSGHASCRSIAIKLISEIERLSQ